MKRLLMMLAACAFLNCATDDDEDPSLPPLESLPEGDQLLVAAERVVLGAISFTADATVERTADGCSVTVRVTQAAGDDGPIYDPLSDTFELDRAYVVRGGAWSTAPEPIAGPSSALHVVAKSAPKLKGEADVVVRLRRKASSADEPLYLAKRAVTFVCR